MPKRMGADMLEAIKNEDRSQLELERTPWSCTGFRNVIKVGNKFQARLQVPGDGRGGTKKRKQHSLPGLFDTAEDAAVMLAVIKRGFRGVGDGKMHSPPKQNKQHKTRRSQPQPAVQPLQPVAPAQTPMATAIAVPVPFFVANAPLVAVTPVPMQPLPCYAPSL
jgi:hypothetical protein